MSTASHEALDVLAIGAHPDDVEIGCGGTVALLASQGYRVGIVDLTDGEPTPASPGPEVRLAEAQAAADCLGAAERVCLELPNRRLFDSPETSQSLAGHIRRCRPQLVIALGSKTPLASPDHWQTEQIVDAAIHIAATGAESTDEPPYQVEAVLYYALIFGSGAHPRAGFDLYVDISATLETKLAAIHCYKTQFPPHKQSIFPRVRSMAEERGISAGCDAAERLISPRPLISRDLMQTILA